MDKIRFVCDQRKFCKEADFCGGAKPHIYDDSECGQCPFNKSAKCIQVT